jgi:hypothetical protein
MKILRVVVFCAVFAMTTGAVGETLTLLGPSKIFDGEMYGSTGCDTEVPAKNCQYVNGGGLQTMRIGKSGAHVSTAYRALMGFDLSDLPAHSCITVDSAWLTLRAVVVGVSDSALRLGFQSLKYNVIEGEGTSYSQMYDSSFTWLARIFKLHSDTIAWQIGGAKGSDDREETVKAVSPPITSAGSYRIDLTDLIRHWMDSSATERWCVVGDTLSAGGGRAYAIKEFYSSEYADDTTMTPKLEVFYRTVGGRRSNLLTGGVLK